MIVNNVKMNIIKDPFETENLVVIMLEKEDFDTKEDYIDNIIHPMNPVEIFGLDIDFPKINAICTDHLAQFDKSYLDNIKINFEKAWKKKSLGERVMIDLINIYETKNEYTSELYQLISRLCR